jgi:hypothetical protein
LLAEPVIDNTKGDSKNNSVEAIKDAMVKKLVQDLMAYANKSIQKNYKVTQDAVSEQQVESAQEVLSRVTAMLKVGADLRNDEFIIYNPVQCTISHLIQMES